MSIRQEMSILGVFVPHFLNHLRKVIAMPSTLSPSPGALVPAVVNCVSASTNTIANSGAKTFVVPTGLGVAVGTRMRAARTAAPTTTWMEGVVTSYVGTALIITMDRKAGSGTGLTDWTIGLAGEPWSGTPMAYVADPTDLAEALTAIIAMRDGLIALGGMAAS